MKNSEFNNSKRGASVGMFYFWTFAIFILLSWLCSSCSTPEIEKKQTPPNLYPTEKCVLTWQGDGKLILIDKTKSVNDTIVKSRLNGSSEIDLIKRGYYELQIIGSTTIFVEITNPRKQILFYQGNNNGLLYQFFNK